MRILQTPIDGGRDAPVVDLRESCDEDEWELVSATLDELCEQHQCLNVGCGPFYVEGWLNTDVTFVPGEVTPDLVTVPGAAVFTLPTEFDQIYLGHVLEHVPWHQVVSLLRQLRHHLSPGGRLLAVGPDVLRSLDLFRQGQIDRDLMLATMEDHVDATRSGDLGEYTYVKARWEGSRHYWNAHEARVAQAMIDAGFDHVEGLPMDTIGAEWPLVSPAPWQCAVLSQVSR